MCNKAPNYDRDRIALLLACANIIAARGMDREETRRAFQLTGGQAGALRAADPYATFDMKKLRWIANRLHIDHSQILTMPKGKQLKEPLRPA